MEEEIGQVVKSCLCEQENPLWPRGYEPFCQKHAITKAQFFHLFAKFVALEFANGEMSYADADLAINQLHAVIDVELMEGFHYSIYLALDSGEFFRPEDPKSVIPWQKYALPAVMEALELEGLLPRA